MIPPYVSRIKMHPSRIPSSSSGARNLHGIDHVADSRRRTMQFSKALESLPGIGGTLKLQFLVVCAASGGFVPPRCLRKCYVDFFFFENLSVVFVTFLFRSTNGLFSDSVLICVSMLIWERDKKCACFALTKVFFVVTLLQRFLEYFMKDLYHKKTFQHTLKYIIIPIYISLYVFLKNITDSI